jgi:hypothetical protein
VDVDLVPVPPPPSAFKYDKGQDSVFRARVRDSDLVLAIYMVTQTEIGWKVDCAQHVISQ